MKIYSIILIVATIFYSSCDAFRMLGGKTAPKTPYQVAIYQQGLGFNCGGALIGPKTVITAGHCAYYVSKRPNLFTVHYGSDEYEKGTVVSVSDIVIHPNFTYKQPENDMAIFHLKEPFVMSENASTIKLASISPAPGTFLNATGWGRYGEGNKFASHLQIAESLAVMNQTVCQKKLPKVVITNHILCVHSDSQGICGGDSGGPLVQSGLLVGIASFANLDCTKLETPNGFADVANLRNFIDKHVI